MSGISAAKKLKNAGYEVVVLEARNRIGGRMWSDESLGTPMDMGAGWIEESRGNPINDLAKEFGIETIPSNFDSVRMYNSAGKEFSYEETSDIYSFTQKLLKRSLRYGNKQDNDISYHDALNYILQKESLTADQKKLMYWRISVEEINAAWEFDKISSYGETEKGFAGDDLIIPGGYAQIPKKLAEGMDIRFSHPVQLIEDSGKSVKITSGEKTFEADFAIVTVTLGVLKSGKIKFVPELPQEKKSAIEKLGMGNMNKLAIQFSEVFWPPDKHFLAYVSETKNEFPVFVNWAYYANKPYLLATLGNAFAEEIYKMTGNEIKERVHKIFSKIFTKASPPVAVKFSAWKWDEFAGGSYSYLPVGVKEENRNALAENCGRIYFAGEATIYGYAATVHGTYLSGQREAKKIINL